VIRADYLANCVDSDVWRISCLALQPELGLLPERRIGIDLDHPADPTVDERSVGIAPIVR
jgi:hypothetical protein